MRTAERSATHAAARRGLALALLLLITGACSALGRAVFREPTVTVRGLAVTNLGLSGGSLEVLLTVHNPNRFALDALGLRYRVEVDSIPVGEGALESRFLVPERDSATVRLPVRFTFAGLGVAGRALLGSGTVRYRVRGDLSMATPLGTFTRAFDRPGRYALSPNR